MTDTTPMAEAFDDLAADYDDTYHDEVARALVGLAAPATGARIADVACGTGAVALAVAGDAGSVLAVDISAAMVAAGRARAARLGLAAAIDWQVRSAVPLPVADGSLDLILCASSLHFLGTAALADWLRALRPGGRAGFTLPLASHFHPRGVFADLVAADLVLPQRAADGHALARAAGFTGTDTRVVAVGSRVVVCVVGQKPG
jgi:ubiquinone/menaquinone biosynthesis C-methylase UbiE